MIARVQARAILGLSGTFLSPPTAGNLLVLAVRAVGTATCSDTVNGAWTKATGINNGINGLQIFYFAGNGGGNPTITVSAGINQMVIAEYSGLLTSSVVEVSNAGIATSVNYALAALNTLNANDLLIGAIDNEAANSLVDTPGFGWVDVTNAGGNVFFAEQIVAVPGAYSYFGTLSGSAAPAMAMVAFKATSLASAATPTFSPTGGASIVPVAVTVTSATPGSTIYYTTDGSIPTLSSPTIANGGVVNVQITSTVKAFAIAPGTSASVYASAFFGVYGAIFSGQCLGADNFASGSLAVNWVAIPTFLKSQVVGGNAQSNTLSVTSGQYWPGFPADQVSEITLASTFVNEATSFGYMFVRVQPGSQSYYTAAVGNSAAQIVRVDSGTPTTLATSGAITPAAGDVWTLQMVGGVLTLYWNYARLLSVSDLTYPTGSPGFGNYSSTNLTHGAISLWRGSNCVQQDGIWSKQSTVINGIVGSFPIGPVDNTIILRESNAQILSGTVYKTWFSDGPQSVSAQMWYAESSDGIHWTRNASALASLAGNLTPFVIKNAGTYYLYCQPGSAAGTGNWSRYHSADGVNWTLDNAAVFGLGTAGQWDDGHIWAFSPIAIIAGTWYALYSGGRTGAGTYYHNLGLATSPDGLTWTRSGSNPVLQNAYFGQAFANVAGTYYIWVGECQLGRNGALPTGDPIESVRYQSTNFTTWTNPVKSIHCSQLFESVNMTTGQSYLNSIIEVNGQTYGYATSSVSDAGAPFLYQIGFQIAPVPIAKLVTINEDAALQLASENFTSGLGPLNPANWQVPAPLAAPQIVAGPYAEPTALTTNCYAAYIGKTFAADQYSEVTIQNLAGTGAYVTPAVRMSLIAQTYYSISLHGVTNTLQTTAIYKTVGGTPTQLSPTVNITPQIGDVIRLQVIGSVISLFQNGTLLARAEDVTNAIATGRPGFGVYATTLLTDSQVSLVGMGNANVQPQQSGGSGDLGPGYDFRIRL